MDIVNQIKSCVTVDGKWDYEEIQKKDPEFWKEWIGLRIRGNDPWQPYSKDELGDCEHLRFEEIYSKSHRDTRLGPLQEGAADFLVSLDAKLEDATVLLHTMELVGLLRVNNAQARSYLRRRLGYEDFLGRDRQSKAPLLEYERIHLHRAGLYALAGMQTRGNPRDQDIFEKFFLWDDAKEEALSMVKDGENEIPRYPFMPASFSGYALSSLGVPQEELLKMLEVYQSLPKGSIRISPVVLALWVGYKGDAARVANEIWYVANKPQDDKAKERWDIIRRCADRMWPREIKPYDDMVNDNQRTAEWIGPTVQE